VKNCERETVVCLLRLKTVITNTGIARATFVSASQDVAAVTASNRDKWAAGKGEKRKGERTGYRRVFDPDWEKGTLTVPWHKADVQLSIDQMMNPARIRGMADVREVLDEAHLLGRRRDHQYWLEESRGTTHRRCHQHKCKQKSVHALQDLREEVTKRWLDRSNLVVEELETGVTVQRHDGWDGEKVREKCDACSELEELVNHFRSEVVAVGEDASLREREKVWVA
jgi:hypothetical protein